MEREDRLATEIRSAAEKRQQDVNRLLMAREEERSRMAQVLEIQREHLRVRRQEACRRILVHRKRVALLGLAWGTWQCVVADEMEVVLRIQRCYRTYMRHRRIHECEDEGETTPEYASEEAAAAAAMVVQSMFRGFSIRRKFANALEMAQLVGGVDELEFGEVNLDDLIQMPPELEDGWENPVLPASRCYQQQSVASVMNQFDGEEGPESGDYEDPEQPEYENYAPVVDSAMDRVTRGGGGFQYANGAATSQLLPLEDSTPPAPAPPASLASNLWDKMRKMKQKQRHAAEERSREQDPTYRLQKLMSKGNKKPPQQSTKATSNNHNGNQSHAAPNTTASNAPTISWGSSNSNGEKKKPKVKLPSLVERLRKKTEAAR
ncbi:Leucine-rich repeat, ribonuclease inhibitor subtype [Globisporangium polare]